MFILVGKVFIFKHVAKVLIFGGKVFIIIFHFFFEYFHKRFKVFILVSKEVVNYTT